MSNVPNLSNEQILNAVKRSENFKQFPNGILDVWVRSDEDAFNQFDDKVYTFECFGDKKEPKFIMVCTGTSNAGAEGLKRFGKYNREGCAVLKANFYVENSHTYGLHKGQYPAYRQAKDFPYYRDGDQDNKAEEIGEIHHGVIGANCHKAGWHSTEIGGWSVACLVRNQQAQFNAWMKFMAKRPLSVCILQESFLVETLDLSPDEKTAPVDSVFTAAELSALEAPSGAGDFQIPQIPDFAGQVKDATSDLQNQIQQTTQEVIKIPQAIPQKDEIFGQLGAQAKEAAQGWFSGKIFSLPSGVLAMLLGAWAWIKSADILLILGFFGVGALIILVYLALYMWLKNKREARESNERIEETKLKQQRELQAHELTILQMKSAMDKNANTVQVVPTPIQNSDSK